MGGGNQGKMVGALGATTAEVGDGVGGLDGVNNEGKSSAVEAESGANMVGSESKVDVAQKDEPAGGGDVKAMVSASVSIRGLVEELLTDWLTRSQAVLRGWGASPMHAYASGFEPTWADVVRVGHHRQICGGTEQDTLPHRRRGGL